MKKPAITIILLMSVLSIWSVIIYKVYGTIKDEATYHFHSNQISAAKNNVHFDFSIHTYDRDPFLSVLTDTIAIVAPPKTLAPVVKKVDRPPYQQPQYCGQIVNDKNLMAIIKKYRKYFFVSEDDTFEEIKIRRVTADSLIVMNRGMKIVIRRSGSK